MHCPRSSPRGKVTISLPAPQLLQGRNKTPLVYTSANTSVAANTLSQGQWGVGTEPRFHTILHGGRIRRLRFHSHAATQGTDSQNKGVQGDLHTLILLLQHKAQSTIWPLIITGFCNQSRLLYRYSSRY